MTAINQQTPGPVGCIDTSYAAHDYRMTKPDQSPLLVIASCNDHSQPRANARLLAAAYTAFDGAGRKLGIDAADMAERLGAEGLAEVIEALYSVTTWAKRQFNAVAERSYAGTRDVPEGHEIQIACDAYNKIAGK